ncbi:MAG: tail fiber domain-containing protein [Alphaproteobacteria bacterium]
MKTTIRSVLIIVALLFPALPTARAISPPPDGCYPNYTTAEGCNALGLLSSGAGNTGLGWYALSSDTTGSFNTSVGGGALVLNNGDSNTAVGAAALLLNTTGSLNTAVGTDALVYNDSGGGNTANGAFALFSNTTGTGNAAVGYAALYSNTTAGDSTTGANTAIGRSALSSATTSGANTAIGYGALGQLTQSPAGANTALGDLAGYNITGTDNICIGAGVRGVTGENNTIRIGDNLPNQSGQSGCYIGGIYAQAIDPATASLVGIDATGKLGTIESSQRFKRNVKPMDKASEAILALKPVTFYYKRDAKNTPCFGLIAEEVESVSPSLVVHDKNGRPYTVRYDQVNAMLLNEFLKEHRKVRELQAALEAVDARLKTQEALLQKVSALVQTSKPARQVASRD